MILAVGDKEPRIAPGAFVATSAVLIGEVTLQDRASVWYQAVLDGGQGPVRIGPHTNVQDGAILTGTAEAPLTVGAGAVVPRGGDVPARTLVLGNPAAPKRAGTEEEVADNRGRVERYAALAQSYRTAAQISREGGADQCPSNEILLNT